MPDCVELSRPPVGTEAWRRSGRRLSLGGRAIFLREAGYGPPLLLLHAYPTASWGFHRIWPDLVQRYQLSAPDLPGSGFADKPSGGTYSIGVLTDVVEALLDRIGSRPLHILAHGYGSCFAQELLARRRPEVASVAFVCASLFPESKHETAMQRLLLSPLGPLLARCAPQPKSAFRHRFAATFGRNSQPSEAEIEAAWTLLRAGGGQRVVPRVIGYLRERHQLADRLVGALERADIPLALICAPDDRLSGAAVIEAWRRRLPGHPVYPLPAGIGHYPPLECPRALVDAYLRFREEM